MGLMVEVKLVSEPMSVYRDIDTENSRFCDLGSALILEKNWCCYSMD